MDVKRTGTRIGHYRRRERLTRNINLQKNTEPNRITPAFLPLAIPNHYDSGTTFYKHNAHVSLALGPHGKIIMVRRLTW